MPSVLRRAVSHLPGWEAEVDPGHFLASGLVAWYLPGTTTRDLAGVSPALTPTAAPSRTTTKLGTFASLNAASSQYLITSDACLPTGAADRTISMRFATTLNTFQLLGQYGKFGGANSVIIYENSSTNIQVADNGGQTWINATLPAFNDGAVHHFILSYVGSTNSWAFLFDGVSLTTSTGITAPATQVAGSAGLMIGRGTNSGGTAFTTWTGAIDDVRVWNRALSLSEMRAVFDRPFEALRPTKRRTFYLAAAGGGSVGTAAGSGAASGVGASTAASAGSSAGAGAASGVGAPLFSSVGTSAGAGTATGVSGAAGVAVGTAAGAGAAAGVGASQAAAVASAAGAGSAAGVARALFSAIATAAGSSTAAGVSPGGAVGTASGSATVSGVGASRAAAVGTAAGLATVAGIAAGGTARRPLIFVVT